MESGVAALGRRVQKAANNKMDILIEKKIEFCVCNKFLITETNKHKFNQWLWFLQGSKFLSGVAIVIAGPWCQKS
jgi:intracellular sulfur oxidation DsrE/DsrF family protein